ncbi:cytochrome c oxidase assembly protein [Steroidobacter cummioxidans]|uniref:cytochrome c oxidase assembly protein n=1 Tax=Steroidobacter cummioxidans TaxID=1803913 RepID=UPI000E31B70A|nr:cytochrome c oxidase assembly protein [Steroidobacter cummioxidans]
MNFGAVPYCGTAPLAADLWSRWNFDPWLIAALLTLAYLGYTQGHRDIRSRRALIAALLLMGIAFISPLCALASALFSARVAHHLLLIAAAAPLLAIVFTCRRADEQPDAAPVLSITTVTLAHAIVVWVWHSPAPYLLALSSDSAYWLMQLSLLLSAFLLWKRVLSPRTSPGAAVLSLLATMMQMGLLGALLVFAPRPVFTPHFGTTGSFGLTELQDQQLAGLLMWVPAMLPYFAVALVLCATLLRKHEAPAAR